MTTTPKQILYKGTRYVLASTQPKTKRTALTLDMAVSHLKRDKGFDKLLGQVKALASKYKSPKGLAALAANGAKIMHPGTKITGFHLWSYIYLNLLSAGTVKFDKKKVLAVALLPGFCTGQDIAGNTAMHYLVGDYLYSTLGDLAEDDEGEARRVDQGMSDIVNSPKLRATGKIKNKAGEDAQDAYQDTTMQFDEDMQPEESFDEPSPE